MSRGAFAGAWSVCAARGLRLGIEWQELPLRLGSDGRRQVKTIGYRLTIRKPPHTPSWWSGWFDLSQPVDAAALSCADEFRSRGLA